MYLLPALREHVKDIALVDTAPDSSWHPAYVAMTQANPLPEFEATVAAYTTAPTLANLTALVVASAPWNCTPAGLDKGCALLSRMPPQRRRCCMVGRKLRPHLCRQVVA